MVILLVGLMLPSGVWARVYKYVDSSGAVHYTDNALEVPENQRPALEELSSQNTAVVKTKKKIPENVSEKETTVTNRANRQMTEKRFELLNRQKKALDAEYEAITHEQKRLENNKPAKRAKRKAVLTYNREVERLNTRIKAYEVEREKFARQIKAYNDRMHQFNEKRKALDSEIQAYNQGQAIK